jgi:GNAT superfamily N-acetyltransferase
MSVGYVRPARPDEAAAIARIQLSTWRTAYRTMLPQSILDGLDETWIASQWRDAITDPPSPAHRVLIAIEQADENHLVGFCASGPADEHALAPEEKPLPDGTAAITDLLVEPRWGRRGHGSRLLAAAVDLWRGDGFMTAIAWAYERDNATRKFLTSAGWALDGASRSLDVDDLLVPQVRLHTSIEAAIDARDDRLGPA